MPLRNQRASCSRVTRAVVGLGTNLGARRALLLGATHALGARPGLSVLARSHLYETPPLGPPQPDYLNAALLVEWSGTPRALLSELHAVERLLGRERRERWGPRTIDLDLLWWEAGAVHEADLLVPHPGLLVRNFALAPWLDVLPDQLAQFEPTLVALGGAPPRAPWPAFEQRGTEHVVGHAGDEADLFSLLVSSVFSRDSAVRPTCSASFDFPVGDAESSVRAWVERAAQEGFAATWACATQRAPTGEQRVVYLGEYRATETALRVLTVRAERSAESLTGIVRVDQRA